VYRAFRSSLNEPFSMPMPDWALSIPGYRNHENACDLSADGLRIYTNRHYWHGPGDLYVSSRASLASPWGPPVPIDSLNTDASEFSFTVSADELCAVFSSDRSGTMLQWTASRETMSDPWGNLALIDSLADFNIGDNYAELSADGLALYVAAQGPNGLGGPDIWKLTRTSRTAPFGEPVLVPELSSTATDRDIELSATRLAYVISERPTGSRYMSGRIFVAHAATPGGPIEGELDCDGDVDLVDFGAFAACLTGPGGGVSLGCLPADYDEDGDVDLADAGSFQLLFTGEH